MRRAVVDACLLGGVSEDEAAKMFDQPISNVKRWVKAAEDDAPIDGDPIPYERLGSQARESLADFGLFTRRYFGMIHTPWQVDAANRVAEKLVTPHREFVVMNTAPALGKTRTTQHDIPGWLTARDRAIRGLLGHRGATTAARRTNLLRRTLARPGKFVPRQSEVDAGRALIPEGSLVHDFGRFKPLARDLWRADEFVVEQMGSQSTTEKEATWTAYGMDSDSIGNRFQYIAWDDLVTTKMLRSADQVRDQREWWVREAEERLEPGGLLILVGQRLGPNDLYRFCLDMEVLADEAADADGDAELSVWSEPAHEKRYTQIIYPAHFEELCTGNHTNLAPWPESCLIDPIRVPWREISAKKERRDGTYEVVLQQKDVAPHERLVRDVWLWGGTDEDGSACPGSFDRDRAYGATPTLIDGHPLPYSVLTCDPSGTGFWSMQHWLYDDERELAFLIQFDKRKYQINEVLDQEPGLDGKHTGMLEDMRAHAASIGHRVTHIVLEINAMNRWANQQSLWRRWEQKHEIITLPHTTGLNKSDPDKGIEAMCSRYRFGKIRFPGASRRDELLLRPFTEELTTATTSNGTGRNAGDAMMASWFGWHNLDQIKKRRPKGSTNTPKKTGVPWKPMGYPGHAA